ncbi:hypothetical protein [Myxosarcina sp. GI1]|uniref:hypothetical protein n=1 Tax=Myxosarcina sp. GI1 TaxID=1541065 RepID=UPI00055B7C2C|nr:hypothetical protein [Myxosarcina sp. GI1]
MNDKSLTKDLAGEVIYNPTFWQTKERIDNLVAKYLSSEQLRDRLEDLPRQFQDPQPRKWQPIDWHKINPEQIIDIDLDIFLSIIKGAIDTEAPIHDYTQTSRQYLEPIHSLMARFVGGVVKDGKVIEIGLWEREERQHTPALIKVYRQLTKEKINPKLRTVRSYRAVKDPYRDLYGHGLHRIITEYGAVCLYLWLMARTTGTIQQVLAELLQDEINHMTKFWGVGLWLYPNANSQLIGHIFSQIASLLQPADKNSNLVATFHRLMSVLDWQSWSSLCKIETIYTFVWILQRMSQWSSSLTPEYLQPFCASPQFFDEEAAIALTSN